MADGLYAVFHRFEAFLKKVDTQAVTVGCPSNSRRASSISSLPAPAAQTSAGETGCSLLPTAGCAAAQASLPHCTPIAGLVIPLLTHTSCYFSATTTEPVNPRTLLRVGIRWQVFPGSTSSSSRPRCHQKWTVRGEADSWVHSRTQGNASLLCAK